jgi:O-antigen ligase
MMRFDRTRNDILLIGIPGILLAFYLAAWSQLYSQYEFVVLKKYDLLANPVTIPLFLLGIGLAYTAGKKIIQWLPTRHLFFILALVGVSLMQFKLPLLFVPIALCYLYYGYRFMMGKQLQIQFSTTSLAIYAIFVLSIISLFSFTKAMNIASVYAVDSMISRVLVFTFAMNVVRKEEDITRILKYILIFTFFECFVAFYQSFMWIFYKRVTTHLTDQNRLFTYYGGTPFVRTTGTFNNTGAIGLLINLSAIVLVSFLFAKDYFNRKKRLLFIILLVILLLAFLSNSNRSNWVGFTLVMVVFPLLRWPKHFYVYILAAPALFILLYVTGVIPYLVDWVISINEKSFEFRFYLLGLFREAFSEHPFSGVGIDMFERYPGNWDRLPVHNAFLLITSECGLLAGILFFFYYISLMVRLFYHSVRTLAAQEKLITRALSLALLAIFIAFQYEPGFYNGPMWLVYGFCESILLFYRRRDRVILRTNT